jgi:putative aldouronate transport system permease protein
VRNKNNKNALKDPLADKVLYNVINIVLIIFVITVAYPIIYILSSSFSAPTAVAAGRVVLWPVDFSVIGYRTVFNHKYILSGYRNTIFYTVVFYILSDKRIGNSNESTA